MRFSLIILGLLVYLQEVNGQFVPIPVTGYNQDVIAEGGPSSLATTSAILDAAGSNKVMYSTAFAVFAGITAGLPNSPIITVGPDVYSLGSYTANNAMFVFMGQSLDLTPVGTNSYSKLRIVCFSTEGPSTVNISLSFSDLTTTNYISNYILPDWFFGSSNIILQGFGRCSRTATGPWPPDGLPSNPKIYYIEITLNCVDKPKTLQRITCSNVSTSGNAPFPNAVFLGVSGISSASIVNPTITPADCAGTNGSISLNVSGGGAPYTYSWNTVPVQTGPTATGLNPGSYTCTITDALGCTSTIYTGVVPLNNNATINTSATPAVICPGAAVQLNATPSTGPLTSFTWNPGNITGSSVSVSPLTTTTYTLTANNAIGCTATSQVTVNVNPVPASPVVNNVSICSGASANLQVINPQPGFVYNWYSTTTGGTVLATGASYTTPVLTATTTYYVDAVNIPGCTSNSRTAVTVTVNNLPAPPVASDVSVCPNSNVILNVTNPQPGFVYNWYNSATGGTPLVNGISLPVNNVTSPVTFYVDAVNSAGCFSNTRTPVNISLLSPLPIPVVVLGVVTGTSLSFSWTAIPGAIGYEITTNGGASFQPPSSGPNGTTHTITGLTGNATITLQVRALGNQPCETSQLSVAVTGTTLSTKEIFVPNIFTPNGDGKNDKLFVYGNYIASMQFRIFNQWGQLIFFADNISQGWDGSYKGQQQPIGVYAYTLKVILNDNSVVNKKGAINLIR